MLRIVVYDLNRTLYRKSSKNEFFKFIRSKENKKTFKLLKMLPVSLVYSMKLLSKTRFKQHFYSYLDDIPPEEMEGLAREFWSQEYPENFRKSLLGDIQKLRLEGVDVYIVTGAYEVYAKYIENLLPVKVIGTRTKYENGKYIIQGKACNDAEKVRRLKEEINGDFEFLKAYSDDDEQILYEAEKGYYLKNSRWMQVQK